MDDGLQQSPDLTYLKRREDPLWRVWCNLRHRCYNRANRKYEHYGGRGITVSKDWLKYDNFARDMRPTYRHGLSIDRIDNNRGYSKDNCRWATAVEQNNNRRNSRFLTYQGVTKRMKEWADYAGISYGVLNHRYYEYGWSLEKSLTTPVGRRK